MKKPLPQLKTAMTPFPYAIDREAPLEEAAALLAAHDFHHLPVMHGGHLVGMLSSGQINAAAGPQPARRVRNLYTPDPYIVDINTRLATVLYEMAAQRADSAIVVRHGKLAGVFTAGDACRAFAELLDTLEPPPGDGNEAA